MTYSEELREARTGSRGIIAIQGLLGGRGVLRVGVQKVDTTDLHGGAEHTRTWPLHKGSGPFCCPREGSSAGPRRKKRTFLHRSCLRILMSSSSSLSRLWSVSTVCSVFLESVILESSVFGNETMTNILKTQTTIARSNKEHCKTEKTSGPLKGHH